MKKKMFILPLLAALALTGCSADEDLRDDGNEDGKNGYGYVAVNIVQPKSTGTRANENNNFEDGSEDENTAWTALFFIFNSDGNIVGNPQEISLTGTAGTTSKSSPYVERIYNAVLVIDGANNKPTDTYKIVCVLNAPAGLKNENILTFSGLEAKIDDYGACEAGKFIMTNSVYKDGNTKVLGAIVDEKNIKKTADLALANPVDVYVERVVAKIKATAGTVFANDGATVTVDGVEKNLTINVTGIEVANIAEKSYLFKNIDGITYDWTWSDPTNKRSYWETVPKVETGGTGLTFGNKSYEDIVNESRPETGDFNIRNLTDFKEYVQPNTCGDQKTAILVTAELKDDTDPFSFVYLRGGYFTPDAALALIAQYAANNGYYKKTSADGATPEVYSQLGNDDFEWRNNNDFEEKSKIDWLKSYEVVAQVESSVISLYKRGVDRNGEVTWTKADVNEVNNLLKGDGNNHPYVARFFTGGKCYYYVNIDQTPVANDNKPATATADYDAHKYDGVIRNHIYDLTLESIKGIGTPVFDPKDVIIPEKPENETLWYLSARINVLKWRIVKQNVNFGD